MIIPIDAPAVSVAQGTAHLASSYLVPSLTSAAHAASATGIGGSITGSWSSLIGVITAIVGNVLISFALNTQRYAHIRLSREQEEKQKELDQKRAELRRNNTDGAAHEDGILAENGKRDRRRQGKSDGVNERGHENEDEEPTETDALLPRQDRQRNSTDSQATLRDDGDGEVKQKSYLKSPYWWAGVIMMTIGEGGNFLAYGFAPASVVSPLGVVALISNCVIAPFLFNEPFRKRDILGVVIAVAGAVTVVLSASGDNPKLGPEQIWKYIATWQFETYFGITVGLIIALMWASRQYGQKSILIDLGLVGLFGGYTALSTKGIASLLSYKLWRLITFPVSYLLIFILVFTAVMQIKYVNRALQRFEATQVIPTQFVMFTLSVILGSAILYQDFKRTSTDDAMKFFGGCAMTFCGVWLITTARPSHDDDEDEFPDTEPPEAIDLVDGDLYQDDEATTPTAKRRSSEGPGSSHSSHCNLSIPPSPIIETTPPSSIPADSWTSPSPAPYNLARTISNQAGPTSISDPHLPTLNTVGLPPNVSDRIPSAHPARPQTPSRNVSDTPLYTPTTPLTPAERVLAERADARSRHAIAGALPTPMLFSSPLNSGLSAMVADLRRHGSHRSKFRDSIRRQRSALGDEERGSAFGPQTPSRPQSQAASRSRESLGSGTRRNTTGRAEGSGAGLLRTRTEEGSAYADEENTRTVRRGRSMSNSLRGFFRSWGSTTGREAEETLRVSQQGQERPRRQSGSTERT